MMGVWSPSLGSQDQGFGSVARLQITLPLMVTSARDPCGSPGAAARPAVDIRARIIAIRMPMPRGRAISNPLRPVAGVVFVADGCRFAIVEPSATRSPPDLPERPHRAK